MRRNLFVCAEMTQNCVPIRVTRLKNCVYIVAPTHVGTCVLLSQKKVDDYVEVSLELDEDDITPAERKATYQEIQNYILDKYSIKVSSLYISQIKRKNGLEVGESYNKAKTPEARVPNCPAEKEKYIEEALYHFQML